MRPAYQISIFHDELRGRSFKLSCGHFLIKHPSRAVGGRERKIWATAVNNNNNNNNNNNTLCSQRFKNALGFGTGRGADSVFWRDMKQRQIAAKGQMYNLFYPESSVSLNMRVPAAIKHTIIHWNINHDDSFHHLLSISHGFGIMLQSVCSVFYSVFPLHSHNKPVSHGLLIIPILQMKLLYWGQERLHDLLKFIEPITSRDRFQPKAACLTPKHVVPTRKLLFMLCWLIRGCIHLFHHLYIHSKMIAHLPGPRCQG